MKNKLITKTLEKPMCEARWGDSSCGKEAVKLLPVNGQMFQLCADCYKITKKQNALTY